MFHVFVTRISSDECFEQIQSLSSTAVELSGDTSLNQYLQKGVREDNNDM